ncbi:MAG: energy transducer TonB, partial [Kiritimatiellia bacterium]|nr:energy transducer TonB [Kiritimatiellia bacterium]
RINRREPPPTDPPLSQAEIDRLLKLGAHISNKTTLPPPGQIEMGAYFNHVKERMYAAWQQPGGLGNLPGLSADVAITVEPGGRITARRLSRTSGNALMDDSVMKAVQSVAALRPMPAGQHAPKVITITFELTD